ncbi:unnamed protein product [Rhodiola kirilowii]
METCIVVAQQRTQYESRGKSHAIGGSPSSSSFREINCRGFQSGVGLLPTPSKTCRSNSSTHVARSPNSFMAESQSADFTSETQLLITSPKSVPIPIKSRDYKSGRRFRELSYSERWAGPTYSNSPPPPSSVPIPKFSTRSKPTRTVSLELDVIVREDIEIHPHAKSAPASPRELHLFARDLFGTADNATKALRRILNLDMCDE